MSAHDADRLTDEDRAIITAAMDRAVAGWNRAGYTGTWGDLDGLERIGVHAIGRTWDDLRTPESEWMRSAGIAALGLKSQA